MKSLLEAVRKFRVSNEEFGLKQPPPLGPDFF
jgi:hypothetical protein